MKGNLNELKIKSIKELIIPDQLQGCVRLIEMLINNQINDSSCCEIIKLINDYSIKHDIINPLLYKLSYAFPQKSSLLSNIGEIMQKQKIINHVNKNLYFNKLNGTKTIINVIVLDKFDKLIVEIEKDNFCIEQQLYGEIYGLSPECKLIDIACKYGSENCFKLLRLKGAEISDKTSIYAFEAGNKNII